MWITFQHQPFKQATIQVVSFPPFDGKLVVINLGPELSLNLEIKNDLDFMYKSGCLLMVSNKYELLRLWSHRR